MITENVRSYCLLNDNDGLELLLSLKEHVSDQCPSTLISWVEQKLGIHVRVLQWSRVQKQAVPV